MHVMLFSLFVAEDTQLCAFCLMCFYDEYFIVIIMFIISIHIGSCCVCIRVFDSAIVCSSSLVTFMTGTIPTEYGGLVKLTIFSVLGNFLTGMALAKAPRCCSVFRTLCCSCVLCVGPLPSELGSLVLATQFRFDQNSLTGNCFMIRY